MNCNTATLYQIHTQHVRAKKSDNDKPAKILRKAIMLEQKLKVISQIIDNQCQVNTGILAPLVLQLKQF
jgi:hypothetical protein